MIEKPILRKESGSGLSIFFHAAPFLPVIGKGEKRAATEKIATCLTPFVLDEYVLRFFFGSLDGLVKVIRFFLFALRLSDIGVKGLSLIFF